jgi:CspA family cold shock protein
MPTGKVKWFNNAKGYGFIVSAENTDDIFAHYSAIEMEGYKTLKAGQLVNFEVANGNKGVHAEHIKVENIEVESDISDVSPGNNALSSPNTVVSNTAEPDPTLENYNY